LHIVEIPIGDENIVIQTGKVAKQADGSAWVQQGGTVVFVATVAAPPAAEDLDFFPLTVDYRERAYAIGKIPSVYGRREPRPGTGETLIARLLDHCIRPLFPKEFRAETQVLAMALSSDQVHPPETLALIGASAALSMSSIPFSGPVGGLVIGRVGGQFVANPTYDQLDKSDMEFFVTGTKTALMSVEGGAHEVPEDDVIAAFEFAQEQIHRIIEAQERLVEICGKPKREIAKPTANQEIARRIRELATQRIRESIGIADKQARDLLIQAVRENVTAELAEEHAGVETYEEEAAEVFLTIEREEMRRSILEQGKRVDGRGVNDLRPIECEVAVLPRAHGSALFTRGQTQALSTVTLGTALDEEIVRDLQGETTRTFFLHYNFPGYSVGEVRRVAAPGRREIGHGALAERALQPVMPGEDEFNYTVRVVSEILESNSSSSMATVCGASLALMDAGVPIKKHVAGIGVGLIKDGDQEVILADMLGAEDHLGDMDFKVAGTRDGVSAVQLDIKIEGITLDLMRRAIECSREARLQVLDRMDACLAKPRPDVSPYAPRIYTLKINPDKIRDIIGPGGRVIRKIQQDARVTINVEDDGTVEIASPTVSAYRAAEAIIMDLVAEAQIGKEYTGKVSRVMPFGAFVEIIKGTDGLLHISSLSDKYIRRVEDVLNIGDTVTVRVIKIDDRGRVDLELVSKEGEPPRAPRDEDGEAADTSEARERESNRGRDDAPRDRRPPRDQRNDRGRGRGDRGRGGRGGRGQGGEGSGGRDAPRIPKARY
jgi:polyribonucleotide nucleotidyltransferase